MLLPSLMCGACAACGIYAKNVQRTACSQVKGDLCNLHVEFKIGKIMAIKIIILGIILGSLIARVPSALASSSRSSKHT